MFGEITASTDPDIILSNCKSSNASAGILNNPLPSPSYLAAVIGTFTSNLVGSIIATPEPELILANSKFSIASGGMLNNPPPSPINKDAVNEPVIDTEPVNCEPLLAFTINLSPLATDAVAEPLAINGAAAACTFVKNLPSPNTNPLAVKSSAVNEPLTETEPVNSEPISEPVAEVITLKSNPFATDAVAEPLAMKGAALATTLVINLPSPKKKSVTLILPLT